jgi:hypothetical protein
MDSSNSLLPNGRPTSQPSAIASRRPDARRLRRPGPWRITQRLKPSVGLPKETKGRSTRSVDERNESGGSNHA